MSGGQWQAPGYGPGGAPGGWPGGPGYGAGPGAGPYGWGYQAYVPKPGVVPLKPLAVGDVFSGVFATLQRYAAALYLPLLWSALGSLVVAGGCAGVAAATLSGVFDAVREHRDPTGAELASVFAVAGGSLLLLLLCLLVMSAVATATATVVVRHAVVGRRLTARQAWSEARPVLGRVLVSQLLVGAIPFAVMLVSCLPMVLLAVLTHGGPATALGLLLVVPGWLAGLYVGVRLVLDVPVLVLEGASQRTALRRAWKLNEGASAWWRSLGIPYLVNLVGSTVGQFVVMPFVMAGMFVLTAGLPSSQEPGAAPELSPGAVIAAVVLSAVGVFVGAALTAPLTPVTNALLYIDRRIRRESLDVSLAAAAGVTGWPQAAAPTAGPGAEPAGRTTAEPTGGQDADGPAAEGAGPVGLAKEGPAGGPETGDGREN
ncbi:hypothetical protein [Kitasatospora sp. NPDC059571]|uniref:hypothetical protein n=1 Tax=Kitasatospora sp. NPDC059571 TaxID=3346871 RepID=UPI00367CD34C